MIQIPRNLVSAYTTFIEQRGVKAEQYQHYVKWLRYYLDFCRKYNFKKTEKESLSGFIGKLKEKKQSEKLRKQARHAISFFYEMEHSSSKKIQNDITSGSPIPGGCASLKTPCSHTKKNSFNQVVYSDAKTTSRTCEPPPQTKNGT